MTGFCGVVHFDDAPLDRAALSGMAEYAAYRGTEPPAYHIEAHAGFGCALSRVFTDCADEIQPLTRDGVTVVGQIRLDDRATLISDLARAGRPTSSMIDSALVWEAYHVWGDSCLEHLHGDFAFGMWDAPRRRLFLARDRFGVRPLYYAHVGKSVIFSNELGALRGAPGVDLRLDDYAAADFLLMGNVVAFDRSQTIFRGIRALPPAHQMTVTPERSSIHSYPTLDPHAPMLRYAKLEDYAEEYRALLRTAVKDRVRTKRALITMSGGLDSPTLATLLCQMQESGEIDLELTAMVSTFDRNYPDNDEPFYANLVARRWQHVMRTIFIPFDDYGIERPLLLGAQPMQITPPGVYHLNQKTAVQYGDLVFTGDASDEILRETPLWDVLRGLPPGEAIALYAWLWRLLGHRPPLWGLVPYLKRIRDPRTWFKRRSAQKYDYMPWLNPDLERRLDLPARWEAYWQSITKPISRYQPRAFHGAQQMLQTNPELMEPLPHKPPLHALPFMDFRLKQFAVRLPPQPFNRQKTIIRMAMRDHLPAPLLKRQKAPLGYYNETLLRQPGLEWLNDWTPEPELESYVLRDAVPLIDPNSDPARFPALFHLRPFMLNYWLGAIKGRIGVGLK
jgi:asparagine synthase (glutamine-hydrolysing)